MKSDNLWTFIGVGSVLLVVALLLSGCALTEKELMAQVKADIWLHEALPAEVCEREPILQKIGLYRVITCTDAARKKGLCAKGQKTYDERVSYCDLNVEKQFSMHQKQFNAWIEKLRIALKK